MGIHLLVFWRDILLEPSINPACAVDARLQVLDGRRNGEALGTSPRRSGRGPRRACAAGRTTGSRDTQPNPVAVYLQDTQEVYLYSSCSDSV